MSVKPILFNTDMVRAILDGRKTVTRRCVKFLKGENPKWTEYIKDGLMLYNGRNEPCCKRPPYQSGDILYVRERFRLVDFQYIDNDWSASIEYYADNRTGERIHNLFPDERISWRPSIHMPKEVARIWLKVTDVRVERLRNITTEEALKEGCTGEPCDHVNQGAFGCTDCYNTGWLYPPNAEFMELWDSTIKKQDLNQYGWDTNPWVWVIEFEQCEKPEEENL